MIYFYRCIKLPICGWLAAVLFMLYLPGAAGANEGAWIEKLFGQNKTEDRPVATKLTLLPEVRYAMVRALDFDPDGRLLASRGSKSAIKIWDWRNKALIKEFNLPDQANDHFSTPSIKFSPDGLMLTSCHERSADNVISRTWSSIDWSVLKDLAGPNIGSGCDAMAFTPDSRLIIQSQFVPLNSAGNNIVIYDARTWIPIWGIRTTPFYVTTIAVSPDGEFAALGGEVIFNDKNGNGLTAPWSDETLHGNTRMLAILDLDKRKIIKTIISPGVMDRFSRLVWSPNKEHIAAAGGHGLQVFVANTGSLIMNIQPKLGTAFTSLAYSGDGKYLLDGFASTKSPGRTRIWSTETSSLIQEIQGNAWSISTAKSSSVFAIGGDSEITVWAIH